jgi:hypothetical protein
MPTYYYLLTCTNDLHNWAKRIDKISIYRFLRIDKQPIIDITLRLGKSFESNNIKIVSYDVSLAF